MIANLFSSTTWQLFAASIALGISVGCAGPGAAEDWSDEVPQNETVGYIYAAKLYVDGDSTDNAVYGVGYKMENSRNRFRIVSAMPVRVAP